MGVSIVLLIGNKLSSVVLEARVSIFREFLLNILLYDRLTASVALLA